MRCIVTFGEGLLLLLLLIITFGCGMLWGIVATKRAIKDACARLRRGSVVFDQALDAVVRCLDDLDEWERR